MRWQNTKGLGWFEWIELLHRSILHQFFHNLLYRWFMSFKYFAFQVFSRRCYEPVERSTISQIQNELNILAEVKARVAYKD